MTTNTAILRPMTYPALTRGETMNGKLKLPRQRALIEHTIDGEIIHQRPIDGYVNATAMCRKAGKEFKHYNENKTTKEFVKVLSAKVGIPTLALIQTLGNGNSPPKLFGIRLW